MGFVEKKCVSTNGEKTGEKIEVWATHRLRGNTWSSHRHVHPQTKAWIPPSLSSPWPVCLCKGGISICSVWIAVEDQGISSGTNHHMLYMLSNPEVSTCQWLKEMQRLREMFERDKYSNLESKKTPWIIAHLPLRHRRCIQSLETARYTWLRSDLDLPSVTQYTFASALLLLVLFWAGHRDCSSTPPRANHIFWACDNWSDTLWYSYRSKLDLCTPESWKILLDLMNDRRNGYQQDR